jgi:hypothetical protein
MRFSRDSVRELIIFVTSVAKLKTVRASCSVTYLMRIDTNVCVSTSATEQRNGKVVQKLFG